MQRALIVVLLLTLGAFAPAPAQPEGSLVDDVQALERALALPEGSQAPVVERVAALEQRVFGQIRGGPVLERVAALKAAAHARARPGAPAVAPAGHNGCPAAALPGSPGRAPGQGASVVRAPAQDPLALVDVFPPQFVRIDPPNARIKTSGDYFPEVMKATGGRIFRFKTVPIPVFITPFPDADFTDSVVRGFESWEDTTSGLVRFVQVAQPDEARIKVTCRHLGLASRSGGCLLGAHTITRWKTRPPGSMSVLSVGLVPVPLYMPKVGPKYSVPPQVIEVNLDLIAQKDPEIRYQVLQNIVTHELGHALGILGHSPDRKDMMYPVTDEHSRLSPRDINTITRIYAQKVNVPL